jgi:nucleoside-diphosphate-sugar epimerase
VRIAVSGATGFIGSHLVAELAKRNHTVTGTIEMGQGEPVTSGGLVPVDIASGKGVEEALREADVVCHLAARNHVLKERALDPLAEYRNVNVEGTRYVARAAVRNGARLFVHFSSVKAMADESGDVPLVEETPCKPKTPYGISKLESEEAAREELAGSGTALVVLRLPMVYGPGNKGNLPRMIRWAQRGLPFPLFLPENLRSMVYVGNVVAGVNAVLNSHAAGFTGDTTYILKDELDCSTRMVYSSICRALGATPRFLPLPSALVRFGGRISEDFRKITSSFRVSSAKITRELRFSPPVPLEQGISETVRWYERSAR